MLQIEKVHHKPLTPFKFYHGWLEDDEFKYIVLNNGKWFDSSFGESTMQQFWNNFKQVKKLIAIWVKKENEKDQKYLKKVEEGIALLFEKNV